DDGTIVICNWAKWQNLEGLDKIRAQTVERMRQYRQRKIEQKNERLLLRYRDDVNKSSRSEQMLDHADVTSYVTSPNAVTQKWVTHESPEEEEDKNKKSSLPSLLKKERQPANPADNLVSSKDSAETLRQKLLAEGKDPADYVVDLQEAKRLICERILGGR